MLRGGWVAVRYTRRVCYTNEGGCYTFLGVVRKLVAFRISEAADGAVRELAVRDGVSFSEALRRLLKRGLEVELKGREGG